METKRKNSRKRKAILEALSAVTDHPSADMLYAALKPRYPELSLGTVYRNLAVLAEEGLVVSVAHVAGQERYDARTEDHAHFICRACRRVIDLELEDTVSPLYAGMEERFGLRPEGHSLNICGLCPRCAE